MKTSNGDGCRHSILLHAQQWQHYRESSELLYCCYESSYLKLLCYLPSVELCVCIICLLNIVCWSEMSSEIINIITHKKKSMKK